LGNEAFVSALAQNTLRRLVPLARGRPRKSAPVRS
jgi:hypothetical protein